ncbi:MAG: YicC/YloC family endoribonuclease [Planctomycetota bacterium]
MSPVVSMTGVGSASGDTALGRTVVELRAVNGRSLVVKHRLTAGAAGLDLALERAIAARVRRGSVICTLEAVPTEQTRRSVVDRAALRAAVQDLRAAAAEVGLQGDVRLADALALPGVVLGPNIDGTRLARDLPADVADLLERALAALVRERQREGEATARVVGDLLAELGRARVRVAARAPRALADYRGRLLARVNEVLAGQTKTPLEPSDVIREVAMYAERTDVTEELQRIDAHLDRALELLRQGGEVGRALEFLMQELLREVNTVGSKAQDVEIAHDVVAMKANIDRLRELVANLE